MGCGCGGRKQVAYKVTWYDKTKKPETFPTSQEALSAIRAAGGKGTYRAVKAP